MIHYEWFNTYERDEEVVQIEVSGDQVSEENWANFLSENGISGKLTNERESPEGDIIREYARASKEHQVTLSVQNNQVEIITYKTNIAGFMAEIHRIRGYSGPWQYQVYAVLLDIVGISLIVFAITGAILWLKLLKNDVFAWAIFAAGLIYVGVVMLYLMIV